MNSRHVDRKFLLGNKTQITSCYSKICRKYCLWATTHQTLKQMGHSRRRPNLVTLLSAENWNLRLQFLQAPANWTIKDWKNVACFVMSPIQLQHSDGEIRVWGRHYENINPSCLISVVLFRGDCMVWHIFSWYSSGPLVPFEHAYFLPEYSCWPLLYSQSIPILSCPLCDHVTKPKSSSTGFLNVALCSLCSKVLHSLHFSIQ